MSANPFMKASCSGGVAGVLLVLALGATRLAAQEPWVIFDDPISTSVCDVIHADNAELVLLAETRNLVLVTGADVILGDTAVDENLNVFFEDQAVGLISFQLDGDGARSLWWTGLTGEVVRVNSFTGEPTVTDQRPNDYRNVACDACDFWDDDQACADPVVVTPPVSLRVCGQDISVPIAMLLFLMCGLRVVGAKPA